jgi:hypothetical protein
VSSVCVVLFSQAYYSINQKIFRTIIRLPYLRSSTSFSRCEHVDVVVTELGGVCSFPDGDRSNDVSDQWTWGSVQLAGR